MRNLILFIALLFNALSAWGQPGQIADTSAVTRQKIAEGRVDVKFYPGGKFYFLQRTGNALPGVFTVAGKRGDIDLDTNDIRGIKEKFSLERFITNASLETKTTALTSLVQFATSTAPTVTFDGSIWDRKAGNKTASSLGFGAMVTSSVGGYYYERRLVGSEVPFRAWRPDSTGATDVSAKLQDASNYNSSLTGISGKPVKVHAGKFRIDNTIDLTNTRIPGTYLRDGIGFKGESQVSTVFLCRTGPRAFVDGTGIQFGLFSDFCIRSDPDVPLSQQTQVGMYFGITDTLEQTQNITVARVLIDLSDNPTANQGEGSIGLLNFGAEEHEYNAVYARANLPFKFTGIKPNYNYSPFPQLPDHSLGVVRFTGATSAIKIGSVGPAIKFKNCNSFTGSLYINAEGGSPPSAIVVEGSMFNFDLSGTMEGFGTLLDLYGASQLSRINFQIGNIHPSNLTLPVVMLRAGQGWLINSKIGINANYTGRKLIDHYAAGTTEQVACYVKGTEFISNFSQANSMLPHKVLWNPNTFNVDITSIDKPRYRIEDNNTHKLAVTRTQIRGLGQNPTVTSGAIMKVMLPPVIANLSGQTVIVDVEGMLSSDLPVTNALATRSVRLSIPFFVNSATGAVTMGTVDKQLGTQLTQDSGGNSITDVTVSYSVANNRVITISLTPTYVGGNYEPVYFQGQATMRTGGHTSDRAYLLNP
ncbi:hypothetical protein [Spirosoma fluminis]